MKDLKNNNNNESMIWVVIPTWNRKEDLLECLPSVKSSSYQNLQILVVDNASTDGTTEAVLKEHPDVSVIKLQENIGAAHASNIGFHHALMHGADMILRLDSDTVINCNYIEKLVSIMTSKEKSGIVSGKLFFYSSPKTIWLTGSKLIKWNLGMKEISFVELEQINNNNCLEVDFVPSTGMLIKREVLEQLNGFDQDYLVYYEDYDFCLKTKRAGYKIFIVPTAYLWHKVFSQKSTPWVAEQWNKSKIIFFRKNSLNAAHKIFLIIYAFFYALFRSVFPSKDKGNRGPLLFALRGLFKGLTVKLSNGKKIASF